MEEPNYVVKSFEGVMRPVIPEEKKHYRLREQANVASPIEIRFYDDCLVIYREKYHYSPKVSRMQFDKVHYDGMVGRQYRTKTKRINIIGKMESVWYGYGPDGTVRDTPCHDRKMKKGLLQQMFV